MKNILIEVIRECNDLGWRKWWTIFFKWIFAEFEYRKDIVFGGIAGLIGVLIIEFFLK